MKVYVCFSESRYGEYDMEPLRQIWKVCSNEKDAENWVEKYPHKRYCVKAHYKEFDLDKDYDFGVEFA
jgi:hypothetical protein